ncbi:hypothetical protein CBE79_08425 [Priestia megaterium]|nr:hypothetical protein CBE78_05915 [Priestia megaterium]TPF22864.1 hypothetical protein CBE79_08425 [Priestia megaterium]
MKENPNEELRFLMENQTRSDFFMVMVVGFMYPICSSLDWIHFVKSQSLCFLFCHDSYKKV